MNSLAVHALTLSLVVKFRKCRVLFGLHQFGFFRVQMVVSHQMQHSMYYQKGQLMLKGCATLFRLTLRLRVGHNHFSQGRKFARWHDEIEAPGSD